MNHGSSSATCEAVAYCEQNLEHSGWSAQGYSSSVFLSSGGVGGMPELFGEVDNGNSPQHLCRLAGVAVSNWVGVPGVVLVLQG